MSRAIRLRGSFFFFNDTATTEIYTLSLHDALPISRLDPLLVAQHEVAEPEDCRVVGDELLDPLLGVLRVGLDRKSTRLNSSHANISYAVFCLKKKTNIVSCTTLAFRQSRGDISATE